MEKSQILKITLLITLIILAVIFFPKISGYYANAHEAIEKFGILAPLAYMIMMILAILISPIPASPLVIIAGIAFGPFKGLIYTLISATLGALLAFLLARFLLRDMVSKKLESNEFYKKMKGKSNTRILLVIFLTRLMPHVSFDIVSYASGLTRINALSFAAVTFLGMIPIVFILTYFGSVIQPYITSVLAIILFIFIIYTIKEIRSSSKKITQKRVGK